jgi:UDP-GlcNAc:undecaprenyl-phosphate GlcNAc-1-phosphate transferase
MECFSLENLLRMIEIIPIIITLFSFEILYFRIARYFSIVDKPNHRSLHTEVIIRGGGLVFWLATVLFFCLNQFAYPFFFIGLTLVAMVSFVDDIVTLPNFVRLFFQFASCSILLLEFQFSWLLIVFVIVGVGVINAYNFMDGVNGITGGYSLVILCSLGYLNYHFQFVQMDLIIYIACAVLVFLWFNFRDRAICFGGDVGSVGMGFILIFLLGKLVLTTGNFVYFGFLFLYGIDTIYTLIYRILNKQNIFEAHKLHFFQILVYEYKWKHKSVAILFTVIQLLLNIWIINVFYLSWYFAVPFICLIVTMHFLRQRKDMSITVNRIYEHQHNAN